MNYFNLTKIPENKKFKKGDLFILFGELFNRGYVNGLVDQAKEIGMDIVGITVGRRQKNGLRPLSDSELEIAEKNISGKIINIPLEAGFDFEIDEENQTIVDIVNKYKFYNWEEAVIDPKKLDYLAKKGSKRFIDQLNLVIPELKKYYQPGKNVLIAHIMAGGVIRSKLLLVVANRVFKGRDERYISSDKFWKSGLGRLLDRSFLEVTANTFNHLIQAVSNWSNEVKSAGNMFCVSAYGYHGCEILINNKYQWQTYTPYQQGHAKKKLEEYATIAFKNNISACVFNCPEIRTNSSDIFIGVELSLFPLLLSLKNETPAEFASSIWDVSKDKLINGDDLELIISDINKYLNSDIIKRYSNIETWPMESSGELTNLMLNTSEKIVLAHKNKKDLISDYLSSLIIKATGKLIINYICDPKHPVVWLGHQIISKQLHQLNVKY